MPAVGLVIPAIVNVAAVFAGSEHPPANVIVTTCPAVEPAAAQLLAKPMGSVIVGVGGITNPAGNATVTVSPATSAPVELDVKPTVHVDVAPAVCGDPPNVTSVTAVRLMTTALAGDAGTVSELFATWK